MIKTSTVAVLLLTLFCSCSKVDVMFTDTNLSQDPNLTVMNNFAVNIFTYKKDSVVTTGDSVFVVGTTKDPVSGMIQAASFSELAVPTANPLKDNDVTFDSAVVILFPNGNYYGDTTAPYTISVNPLTENVDDENATTINYYNPHTTAYSPQSLGSVTTYIKPANRDSVQIKLSNQFGLDLFNQIRNNTSAIADQQSFRNYLKGLAITSDAVNNKCIYQFSGADSSGLIRIYYTLHGLFNEQHYMNISYLVSKQYNHIGYDFAGTPMAGFPKNQTAIIASDQMQNYALVNSYLPSFIKITFPDILSIKQSFSYVKIMKATLTVRVNSTLNTTPYTLPGILPVYVAQDDQLTSPLTVTATGAMQTGNLTIDNVLENNTTYSYDITDYINQVVSEGTFSNKSLYLVPYNVGYNSPTTRLVVTADPENPDVQLKLYVLGL